MWHGPHGLPWGGPGASSVSSWRSSSQTRASSAQGRDQGRTWHRLRAWWQAYQWLLVAGLALVTVGLALVGSQRPGVEETLAERALAVLVLFGIGSPRFDLYPHPAARASRWLFTIVALFTLSKVWAALFGDQLVLLRIRRLRDHAVVCGLGDTGTALATALHAAGIPVVALERIASGGVTTCRERGVLTHVGDGREPDVLRLLRIERARFLVAVAGDDGTNAEIVARTRALLAGRENSPLTCLLHLQDLGLYRLMREVELAGDEPGCVRLECFNLLERAAAVLLDEQPFPERGAAAGVPHVLVVGVGRLGHSLIAHAARRWNTEAGRPRVTAIDAEASGRVARLLAMQPAVSKRFEVAPLLLDPADAQFTSGRFLAEIESETPVDAVYVCLPDDGAALAAALALRAAFGGRSVPIAVRTRRDVGLASLMDGVETRDTLRSTLCVFPLLERTCTADLVLRGTHEILAQAIHGVYLQEAREKGREGDRPSSKPWHELADPFKESSRRQADHTQAMLRAVGCRIGPLGDWDQASFEFRPAEIDRMARMEHARWSDERKREGWAFGAKRDDVRKHNPLLVSWEDLPEEVREENRDAIRALPALLARADFAIVREREAAISSAPAIS